MREDTMAFLEVSDAGADVQDVASDVFAQDEGVLDAEAIVPRRRVTDLPVDGAVRCISRCDMDGEL